MVKIELDSVGKRYDFRWIFRKMSLSLQSGTAYGVKGPNGSGKSTLLKIISGYLSPSEGSILYSINSIPIHRDQIYTHVSMSAPYIAVIDDFSVEEMFAFHFSLKKSRNEMSIKDIIANCYLTESKNTLVKHLSSGMMQRLKLAICIWTDAEIYLLDEPGTNLDDNALSWYHSVIASLSQEKLLIVASNVKDDFPPQSVFLEITQ